VWIVAGAIFAGAVHDYLTGMISLRNRGAHLPELAGKFRGAGSRHVVNVFSLLLLLLVGTVFVTAPADLLANLTASWMSAGVWTVIIFAYYIAATIFPIDMIIGRFYPLFGVLLLASALGIGAVLIMDSHSIPELSFKNMHPKGLPIFPMLFLTISCGALSGFHATQSPIISRTTMNERQGRFIFYGMMIAEAIIAMIWAAAAMALFHDKSLSQVLAESGPAGVVRYISVSTLGAVGGTIAVLGVIVLPITSGDTAFRSARMIVADYLGIAQRKLGSRLMICVPLFIISVMLTRMDFGLLWRYFSWANQSLAMIALWIGAVYLGLQRKNYFIAAVPAAFITTATFTYIFHEQIGFGLPMPVAIGGAGVVTLIIIALFFWKVSSRLRHAAETGEPIVLDDGLGEVPLASNEANPPSLAGPETADAIV
jgi:carbon starvation protein CstA